MTLPEQMAIYCPACGGEMRVVNEIWAYLDNDGSRGMVPCVYCLECPLSYDEIDAIAQLEPILEGIA